MELFDLEHGLNFVSGLGHTLNVHELCGIQAGLAKVQSDQKYDKIYFWGKVFGATSDYYVAYGLRDTDFEFPSKQFFFANETFAFAELPAVTEDEVDTIVGLQDSGVVAAAFTGDPGTPLQAAEPAEGEGEGEAQEETKVLTEAHRLALTVIDVDRDTSAVPKGAYMLNEAHQVMRVADFKGLSFSAAQDIASYVHFRPAESTAKLRALASDDVQFHAEFLDSLTDDMPKGGWAARTDAASSFISLRSLVWPGYCAFHIPGTPKFGGVYFGHGSRNKDLPFLL